MFSFLFDHPSFFGGVPEFGGDSSLEGSTPRMGRAKEIDAGGGGGALQELTKNPIQGVKKEKIGLPDLFSDLLDLPVCIRLGCPVKWGVEGTPSTLDQRAE